MLLLFAAASISLIPHPSYLTTFSQTQAPNTASPPLPPQAPKPLVFPLYQSLSSRVLVVYQSPLRPVATSSSSSHGNTPDSSRVFVLIQSCEIQPPQHSSRRRSAVPSVAEEFHRHPMSPSAFQPRIQPDWTLPSP
ncbi:hypothetical protein PIB30_009666 [Stylosanthes scabra]|uniref:Uncharacterized protein n=1 Tax=Stylosanthes scabra TaxID=79078 RepID=A0ABU6U466_9FABA|nr:hypothetical protein [Stylosanthes scabra]